MNKGLKNYIAVVVSVIIAGLIVCFLVNQLEIESVKEILNEANFIYLLPSVLLGLLSLFVRALRWRLLLEPMGYKISVVNSFAATAVTYFANIIIPRSGELFRCTSLYIVEDVPVNRSFGTVIAERVVDVICLFIVVFLAALLNLDLFKQFIAQSSLNNQGQVMNFLNVFVYLSLTFLVVMFLTKSIWKKSALFVKAKGFLAGIKEGLLSILKLKERSLFFFYTILIWVFYFYMTYIVIFALKDAAHLSHAQGLFLLLAGAIGMIIPASGGIGSYHAAMGIAFAMMGFTSELGNSFAILVHTPHTILYLITGLIAIFILYINDNKRKKLKNG